MSSDDSNAAVTSILVVEHDLDVGAALVEQLVADGYPTRLAHTSEHARALARALRPALLVLGDLDSPAGALELLAEVRMGARARRLHPDSPWDADLPTIVVGSKAQEPDLLRAFAAGTDDFLARPAPYLELRARLRALLARTSDSRAPTAVRVGALTIDTLARAVSLDDRPIALRRLEYELLLVLAREPERVFTKHELLRLVWGYRACGPTRTLETHVSRLRHKLDAGPEARWVVNVHGVGYRLT
jgi:two-component system, OmpR family, response regulator